MITKTKYYKKGRSWQKIIFYSFLAILSLAIVGYLTFLNLKMNKKRQLLLSQISALEKEIQILEQKNRKLKDDISKIESESFLEKEARERLGLKKPGEEVVVVLPSKENKKEIQATSSSSWQKFQTRTRDFFQEILKKLKLRD